MNATALHNSSCINDSATQDSRKEKLRSNPNQVNQRFNTDNSTQNLTSLENNDGQKVKATKDFNNALEIIVPELESLPSKVLHHPAKDLASLSLSAAIAIKHSCDILLNLKNSSYIPASANFQFKIQGSKNVLKNKEFKAIISETDDKVKEFNNYLKDQIIAAQECELKENIATLHRTIFHNTLHFSNICVRFFSSLSRIKSLPNDKVLSQIALRNVLDSISILENNDDIEDAITNEMVDTVDDALFLNYMKVNSKSELLNAFAAFISNSPLNTFRKNKPKMTTKNKSPSSTIASSLASEVTSVSALTTEEITVSTETSKTDTTDVVLPPRPVEPSPIQPDKESPIPNDAIHDASPDTTIIDPDAISLLSPISKLVFTNLDAALDSLSKQEQHIVTSCTDILFRFLPHLTLDVFEKYNKKMDFALAEAQALALYNNAKHSELARETNKIVSSEQSVHAPALKSIINDGIDFKLNQLQNKIDKLTKKNKKAKETLSSLKEKARIEIQMQTAKTLEAPSTAIESNQKSTSTNSTTTVPPTEKSCLKRKVSYATEDKATLKERKRLRNQRQRANRRRRKEAQDATPKGKANEDSLS